MGYVRMLRFDLPPVRSHRAQQIPLRYQARPAPDNRRGTAFLGEVRAQVGLRVAPHAALLRRHGDDEALLASQQAVQKLCCPAL